MEKIKEKWGFGKEKVMAYLHYQPTFYHLHVHFNYIDMQHGGVQFEKAHNLKYVIQNIEMDGDYYKKSTLEFKLPQNHGLY